MSVVGRGRRARSRSRSAEGEEVQAPWTSSLTPTVGRTRGRAVAGLGHVPRTHEPVERDHRSRGSRRAAPNRALTRRSPGRTSRSTLATGADVETGPRRLPRHTTRDRRRRRRSPRARQDEVDDLPAIVRRHDQERADPAAERVRSSARRACRARGARSPDGRRRRAATERDLRRRRGRPTPRSLSAPAGRRDRVREQEVDQRERDDQRRRGEGDAQMRPAMRPTRPPSRRRSRGAAEIPACRRCGNDGSGRDGSSTSASTSATGAPGRHRAETAEDHRPVEAVSALTCSSVSQAACRARPAARAPSARGRGVAAPGRPERLPRRSQAARDRAARRTSGTASPPERRRPCRRRRGTSRSARAASDREADRRATASDRGDADATPARAAANSRDPAVLVVQHERRAPVMSAPYRPGAAAKARRPTLGRVQDVITVPNEVAAELAGVADGVLDALRERLGCTISLRGNRLTLDGDDEHVVEARAVVDELVELVEGGHAIGPGHGRRGRRPRSTRPRTSAMSSRTSSGATAARRSRRRRSRRSATSTRSAARRSPSGSARPAPARPTSRSRSPSPRSRRSRSAGSSSRAPRSRPASGSGSFPATCSPRSTRTCARCSTRSTT